MDELRKEDLRRVLIARIGGGDHTERLLDDLIKHLEIEAERCASR
jgi:hypothetical protein